MSALEALREETRAARHEACRAALSVGPFLSIALREYFKAIEARLARVEDIAERLAAGTDPDR